MEKLLAEIDRLEKENCMNDGEHFCMKRAQCLGKLRQIAESDDYSKEQLARKIIEIIDAYDDNSIDTVKCIEEYCVQVILKRLKREKEGLCKCLDNLALTEEEMKTYQEAIKEINEQIKILEKNINEVKGINLDEEILHSDLRKIYASVYDSKDIESAKHFFELGLRASNPLTWEDIACIEDITSTILAECKDKILYDTQESFCKEVLKRFKAQKGK